MNKIFYLLLLAPFLSNCQSVQQNDDNLIIRNFINKNREESLLLNVKNDNTYVIDILTQLKEIEQTKNKSKIDSSKISLNIRKLNLETQPVKSQPIDKNLENIFSVDEYNYLLSQKHKGYWDQKIVSEFKPKETKETSSEIFISKPIYTKNGDWALSYINRPTSSFILILKKEDNTWKEYTVINYRFLRGKIKFKSTKS